MDKKNTIIGVVLLAGALGLMFWQNRQSAEWREQERQRAEQAAAAAAAEAAARPADVDAQPGPAPATGEMQSPTPPAQAAAPGRLTDPEVVRRSELPTEQNPVIENDYIRVELTSWGGAIRQVAFKKYPAEQDKPDVPYVFNTHGDMPALAIGLPSQNNRVQVYQPAYEVVEATPDRVLFRLQASDGIVYERSYTLGESEEGAAPYTLRHETLIRNETQQVYSPETLYFGLGTAAPEKADRIGYNLTVGYSNGESYDYERVSTFTSGSGFLFMKRDPVPYIALDTPVTWAAVKNQFFVSILTPERPGNGIYMDDVVLPSASGEAVERGVTGLVQFNVEALPPGGSFTLGMDYYTGPKEYSRLSTLDRGQDDVMQFGWSFIGFIGKLLYSVLKGIQGVVINWGVAIICLTILVRLLFWPLTAKAAESSRKMSKLQGPLKALKEKYKDNPQKLNTEMMALWKKHKVNPLAGCLPILIQMPIFFALFYMLRASSELRFAHFLWINDLSLPDTVAYLGGFPINVMPILMGASSFMQMRLAPMPGVDPVQAKLMRFMPLIFVVFIYNFASGLVVYWTMSNCMSILQQLHTNHKRRKEDEGDAQTVPATTSTAPAQGTNITKRNSNTGLAKAKKRKKG